MKKWILLFCVIWSSALMAKPLEEGDMDRIVSYKAIQHVMYETYLETDKGLAGVIGYHYDIFFSPEYYFFTAIFGAVTGERGGYGIASVGLGQRKQLSSRWFLDSKALLGSGGGGGLPAGGGFAWEVMTGLSYQLRKAMFFDAKVGYLSFPTGTFNTPIVSLGISMQTKQLYLPF